MYIINDTYFQAPKREIPNLDEADSKTFAELELLIDEKCRLLLLGFLTSEQVTELESYLVDGILPEDTSGIPQKWIDLVNGKNYTANGVELRWTGLIWTKGTYKGSLLADFVYYYFLESQASYMTGVGDAKGNPKGATMVNPTQRLVTIWNEFVKQYQMDTTNICHPFLIDYGYSYNLGNFRPIGSYFGEVSLLQFLSDNDTDYPNPNRTFYEVKNQLGL